jgi:hypothetical protein
MASVTVPAQVIFPEYGPRGNLLLVRHAYSHYLGITIVSYPDPLH